MQKRKMLNYSRLTKFRKFDKKKDFARIKFCESRKKKGFSSEVSIYCNNFIM